MVTLYKRDKKGKVRAWTIEHDAVSYWTISGIYPDGKMTKTAPTFVEQKNVGKANETSIDQQVLNEVASKIQYQIDQGFTYDIPTEEKRFEVSLANKYQDRIEKNKLDFPYIVEPKLDGVRCYIKMVDGGIRMFSRKHKEFVACPHIAKNEFVKTFFETYPDAILDGELYNHELKDDFNKIVSLVKKTKPKTEDLEESAKLVQYHCFDSYYPSEPQMIYTKRKMRLMNLLGYEEDGYLTDGEDRWGDNKFVFYDNFVIVGVEWAFYLNRGWKAHQSIADKEEHVEHWIRKFTSDGYEGIMLKKDAPYFFGRSFDMLKYKRFVDSEFEIVDVEEGLGNSAGLASAIVCKSGDNTFKAGIIGDNDYSRKLLNDKEKVIGKLATVVYQSLTPSKDGSGGVPRFGKVKSIRDYE